ncbi:MAG TPA: hypothetical protein P5555_07320 [Candidatus Paceibacterota bacterium]|nr:hypothetical protein [Verrucomicrobiota bacterium]HRZ44986.1 hypothetical protein [Candidatus Paceibacterota bacterium]HRZ99344.1 hypothetical protein [Candidatus Paceibacterota bacterium]
MTWTTKITDRVAEGLRFAVRGALLINAIIAAVASIYFTTKFVFFLIRYLDRILFSQPW